MALKANVTFNVLCVSVVIILGNVLRSRLAHILNNDIKLCLGCSEDSLSNFTEISERYGFISEEHAVITEDGYILTVFRLNSRRCAGKLKRPPVILMHGLLQSSDAWLDAGTNAGLAFLLSNACYDLWVGNQRGNYYARRHVHLDPDRDPKFWRFSVDETGLYDIPATIDYVLKYTSEKSLNYIGYSQGAGTFFVMCSERPGYCDKANIFIGLAPAARQTHTRSIIYRIAAQSVYKFEGALDMTGYYEFLAKGSFGQQFLEVFCQLNFISKAMCGTFESLFDSFHPGSITPKTLGNMVGHFPAGTSTHNMARYGQSMRTTRFQKFDYGKAKNLELYGVEEPPCFNLSAVTVPFVALYGKNDHLVDTRDVYWLIQNLPNVLEAKEVVDPLWNHFDVTYSQYTGEMIFPKINEYLIKYTYR